MFVENFVQLFIESAPYLLLGMLIAGIIHQCVPPRLIEKVLGEKGSVFNAAIIGAPLPLCSCSVIPVAMGIRRSGASKASTASFLVATPETGVDSIGITYALMGPVMAIARPIAAICSAIVAGMMIQWFGVSDTRPVKKVEPQKSSSCCSNKPPAKPTKWEQLKSVFTFGFGQLLRDFMVWLLIGLFFAAAVTTFVPAGFLAQYGQGVLAMLVVVLISIPMYVCATASTPIAVGLLLSGITPGAALVFMLTGPATNIATLMVIRKELGNRELVLYLASIVVSALAAGLILDYLFELFSWQLQLNMGEHSEMVSTLYQFSAVVLAGLILYQLYKRWMPSQKACCEH
ncbi:MAG: SO_0444 family Cu/Zn efflux transporter [Paraglaciecola sp.]|uniref:SO_0444 family Cu/Zn efflux transporter n=1 Tax=Paraglaciecola sp. TaxID=1920173 RepID=UPI00273E652F|nr:SO_0444 family Cu/Zn efflux transporter [Paraglaciecola sp.]MDP5030159.1 SO_0444 family Cu/Zn efflux transporter [Paraglaciecola sp.]MDP5130428.1 SO_0444 family Cu/Zn efflux transporter [Paraglaciecola sp.]